MADASRRWFRFSLRTLLIGAVVLSMTGAVGMLAIKARQRCTDKERLTERVQADIAKFRRKTGSELFI
jgi:hypothetical protein